MALNLLKKLFAHYTSCYCLLISAINCDGLYANWLRDADCIKLTALQPISGYVEYKQINHCMLLNEMQTCEKHFQLPPLYAKMLAKNLRLKTARHRDRQALRLITINSFICLSANVF